jgi:hypothetical protein
MAGLGISRLCRAPRRVAAVSRAKRAASSWFTVTG